jgi:hypothetical protein
MEVYSWRNPQTKWRIFQQAMFDFWSIHIIFQCKWEEIGMNKLMVATPKKIWERKRLSLF